MANHEVYLPRALNLPDSRFQEETTLLTIERLAAPKEAGLTHKDYLTQNLDTGYCHSQLSIEKAGERPLLPQAEFQGPLPTSLGDDPYGTSDVSIIAVLGQALALQARCTSTYWGTLWKQASENMHFAVEMAPVVAEAVTNNWNAQADATQFEAQKNKDDGIVNLGFAGAALAMGGYTAYTEAGPTQAAGKELTSEAEAAGSAGSKATTAESQLSNKALDNVASDASSSTRNTATRELSINARGGDPEEGWLGKKASAFASKLGGCMKGIYQGFLKALAPAQMFDMMARGINGVAYDGPYGNKIADAQRAAGHADATSKTGEMVAQFHNQSFSRSEDLRQNGQQQISQAAQLIQQTADTVTQALGTLYRG